MRPVLILCMALSLTASRLIAQEGDSACLPLNFLMGSELRIVGSVEAGGMPVREKVGLDEPVIDFLPLDSIISDYGYDGCEDGRNWFRITYTTSDNESVRRYILGDDGNSRWLVSHQFCPVGVDNLFFMQPGEDFVSIADAYFVDEQLYIAVGSPGLHPVQQDHYQVDDRGQLTPVDYPYADIVTRELTDSLDITDRVFGEHNYSGYLLYLSPDAKRMLYFVPGRQVEQCAHFCSYVDGFVANTDGSDLISLGEIPVEASLMRVYWGTDGRLYFTHITESSPLIFTMSFCIEDDCELEGPIEEMAAEFGAIVTSGSVPTTSPDGRYLALSPLYHRQDVYLPVIGPTIIDLETGNFIELPDNGLSGMPVMFDIGSSVMVGVDLAYLQDRTAYNFEFETDRWLSFTLDFEELTYQLFSSPTIAGTNDDIWYFNWNINWTIQNGRLRAFHVQDSLLCIAGGRG